MSAKPTFAVCKLTGIDNVLRENDAVLSLPKNLFRTYLLVAVILCRPAQWK